MSEESSMTPAVFVRDVRVPRISRELLHLSKRRSNLVIAVGIATADHMLIFIALVVGTVLLQEGQTVLVMGGLAGCWLFIGRSLRGLECLVHEASHYNWSKSYKRTNDLLANVLAATAVFSRVERYRSSHRLHHSMYGTVDDPDLQAHKQFGFQRLTRARLLASLLRCLRTLAGYEWAWFMRIGSSPAMFIGGAMYHVLQVIAAGVTASHLTGTSTGIALERAAGLQLVVILLVWPAIRMLSESSEHVYFKRPSTRTLRYEVATTVSNVGFLQRLVLHPHGDAFHAAHHLYPYVPGWHLRKLDVQMALASELRNSLLYRLRLWESPQLRRLLRLAQYHTNFFNILRLNKS